MIRGVHATFFSTEAEKLRHFLRDKLGLPATDVGGGWLIFGLPEAEIGCHPIDQGDEIPTGSAEFSFYCDDIKATVAELTARGVEFTGPITDQGYGLVTHLKMPGGPEIQLYQPQHAPTKRAAP